MLFKYLFLLSSMLLATEAQTQINYLSLNVGGGLTTLNSKKSNGNSLGEEVKGGASFQTSAIAGFQINQSIHIATGIKYFQLEHEHNFNNLIFGTDIINGTVTVIKSKATIKNIGVPLLFLYNFNQQLGGFRLVAGGNFYYQFISDYQYSITGAGANDPALLSKDEHDFNSNNFSLLAGLSYEFPLAKNFALSLSPSIEYFLTNEENHALAADSNNIVLGLTVGAVFQTGK